jgi:hypothetical protein
MASGSLSWAQDPGSASATILRAEFAARLADPELNWPMAQGIAAAEARDTQNGRYDACRWQEIVLARPFGVARFEGGQAREKGREFTAGVSPGGYDSIYYRWETDRYWLQFRCAQGLMSVMVEAKSVAAHPELSAPEVQERAAAMEAEIVRRGPQLLANSSMKLEPTEYGYLIRFHQTDEQAKLLWRDTTNRERRVERRAQSDTGDQWLTFQTIRTDGYSFVFDFPEMGVGPTIPSHTTTTQPGEKTWFKERKPPPPPAP